MTRAHLNQVHSDVCAVARSCREFIGYVAADADDELLALIERMDGLSELGSVCRALCSSLQFDYCVFDLSLPALCEQPARIGLNQLPQAWQQHYNSEDLRTCDPVLERACRSSLPFFWDEIERESKDSHAFFNAARTFGIGSGVTFPFSAPLNTFAVLSFARREPFVPDVSVRRRLIGNAMWLVTKFHEVVRGLALRSCGIELSGATRLTRRERECLTLSGSGYTTSQIATRLKIAPRTVAFHIDRSVTKLGVHSRRAALTRALVLGEIDTRNFAQHPIDRSATDRST